MVPAEATTDLELDTVLSVVTWVFARLQAYIGICNSHHSLWLPVGFAIAGLTVALFKSAISFGGGGGHY